ncbi:MipA/OmpV family protein [Corallincola platygyrae]|uniref:MipA/OmpV family protein n=1 Tax=Corallincola platygyrae TaxID=1193278 RepID=A0ABW4XS28_9GAMM
MHTAVKVACVSMLLAPWVTVQATELTQGVAAAIDRFPDYPLLEAELVNTSPRTELQAEYRGAQFVVAESKTQPLFNSTKHSVSTLVEHSQDPWQLAFSEAERRERVNLGAEYRYQDFWGSVAVSLVSELSDEQRGEYGKLSYSYPIHLGGDFQLFPELSYTYMNGVYAEHYLGQPVSNKPSETEQTSSTSKVSLGLGAKQGLSDHWQLNYSAAVDKLDEGEQQADDSQNIEYRLGVGVAYSF